jgi:hypothetical protein
MDAWAGKHIYHRELIQPCRSSFVCHMEVRRWFVTQKAWRLWQDMHYAGPCPVEIIKLGSKC